MCTQTSLSQGSMVKAAMKLRAMYKEITKGALEKEALSSEYSSFWYSASALGEIGFSVYSS